MESPHVSHAAAESRTSLGFPLGTALFLVLVFSLSGILSCCYHWDKLRRTFSVDLEAPDAQLGSPSKHNLSHTELKELKYQSLPVIMAGDNVPKFIALPSPCQPPPPETRIIVEVHKPPPKPPRIAVPLY